MRERILTHVVWTVIAFGVWAKTFIYHQNQLYKPRSIEVVYSDGKKKIFSFNLPPNGNFSMVGEEVMTYKVEDTNGMLWIYDMKNKVKSFKVLE